MQKPLNSSQFKQILEGYLQFTPTSDQAQLIDILSEFIASSDEREILLVKGYAGTGKTNMVAALSKTLPSFKWRSVLLAPTGRAAKILSAYSRKPAQTIHRKIFRKTPSHDGGVMFTLGENLHRNTVFIIDEASMIGADSNTSGSLGYENLLESLFEYVFSGDNCKLIFVGDTAQLPPVGSSESPALNPEYLRASYHLHIRYIELRQVARQQDASGILKNATQLRERIVEESTDFPKLHEYKDVIRLSGEELQDALNDAYSRYGYNDTLVVTRSNKRANLFNQAVRTRIRYMDDDICSGDLLMVVKNNYFWLDDKAETGFIANGDSVEIIKIVRRIEMYGFRYAECVVKLCDYEQMPEITLMILLDTLYTETSALTSEQQKQLFEAVMQDVADEPIKGKRMAYLRTNPYFNALQVKFNYAVTCHKAQGGQWPCVFIDQGYLTKEMLGTDFLRWLYTAFTRSTEKVYLMNFSEEFFN
ncbi:MAG: AAA family ATPase [Bacteroidetes bacterium]|nr:AAA family ATPase [Bacteroidota bacterium]